MKNNLPIRYLKGVGPKKEVVFNKLGVYTVKDLLYYFPFRYEDRRNVKKISQLKEGELSVVKGKVLSSHLKKIPHFVRATKVRSVFEVLLSDGSAGVNCVWFNQHYLADIIKKDSEIIIYGKPLRRGRSLRFVSPEYELWSEGDSFNIARIVPVYHLSSGLTHKFLRKIMVSALSSMKRDLPDSIPFSIRKERAMPNIVKSLEEIHFPSSFEQAELSRERFIFEELFFSQVLVYLRKAKHRLQRGISFEINDSTIKRIKDNLGFSLTASQEEVLAAIISDLQKSWPMHRLLQGDVGCGKTVVAAFALAVCAQNNCQAAVMVPTEVLAYQHRDSFKSMFRGLDFTIEVLTSSLSKKEVNKIHSDLQAGKINILIGTHSLIQEKVRFKKLALVIIDEEHKFGVGQRALLPSKGLINPHCIVMSATPIPRSLALSLYGDLDLSIIKELPPGRIEPQTKWIKESKREWMYKFIEKELNQGRQAYIVYPVIEENIDDDLKSLEVMHEKLAQRFSSYKVGMFHGRMRSEEKLAVVKKFRAKKTDILVSTTVVEVGVSIENATVMVVENPERFGLAQLHQLRGRVRRSTLQPYFILLSKPKLSDLARRRLKVVSETSDGFKIAEEDLNIRGPGDFFGNLQHGLPGLRIANPLRDMEILKHARAWAYNVIKMDPNLQQSQHRCIREHLDFWFQRREDS